jgi:hypothetical protein
MKFYFMLKSISEWSNFGEGPRIQGKASRNRNLHIC